MCGIVGYIGKNQAKDLLLTCLEKLEYRGYDSAGIAILNHHTIKYSKTKGRISDLWEKSSDVNLEGNAGIAHTRWATHGEPSSINSHPHFNNDKTIAVVHNGIIENYEALRKNLTEKGYEFVSETDTEVLPHLIDYYYKGDLLDAVVNASKKLEGSYAIGVICRGEPNKIVALRKDSPLIVGVRKDGKFIASDIPAILAETKDVYYMEDNEFAVIKRDEVTFYDIEKNTLKKEMHIVNYSTDSAEKSEYEHFMLKEIHEQPKAVHDTILGRIKKELSINLDNLKPDEFKDVEKIYIAACGTAYHAGIVGKYVIEKLAKIPVEVEFASEFRYKNPIINNKTLIIVITQSGETADTLAALRLAEQKGARVLAITNVVGSTVSREADVVFYTHAGPEIAVASTKAYLTQLTAMYIFAIFLAEITKHTPTATLNRIKKELLNIPYKIEETFSLDKPIQQLADDIFKEKDIFYLGRGLDYAVAMEGSLKLKEISYIHSETYAGGELKHGPIALIDKGTVVIVISSNRDLSRKMDSNVKEVITRGAKVIGILPKGFEQFEDSFESVLYIPETEEILYPLLSSVPLQLLAYYVSKNKGCDIDKPRNLAKSVTVE